MVFLSILSFTATISTYGMFLVGICFFWLCYGIHKNESTVINVNVVGLALQIGYTLFYYYYSRDRTSINQQILFSVVLCCSMLAYIKMIPSTDALAIQHLGLMCLTLNILNFAAPLAGLRDVIRSKTTASLPFYLCLANFIVGIQWFMYGVLIDDIYMKVPNFVGVVLTLIQLSLFLIYPSQRAAH